MHYRKHTSDASDSLGDLNSYLRPHSAGYLSAYFQYLGRKEAVVQGMASGKYYRFAQTGAVVEVDLIDKPYLANMPNLKELKNP
ncbi:MAG: hypothetical protein ACT4NX_10795 [Deltaproteobacteria bacterium]